MAIRRSPVSALSSPAAFSVFGTGCTYRKNCKAGIPLGCYAMPSEIRNGAAPFPGLRSLRLRRAPDDLPRESGPGIGILLRTQATRRDLSAFRAGVYLHRSRS